MRRLHTIVVLIILATFTRVDCAGQTESVIHSFTASTGTDGASPLSKLIYDPATQGFYGTTAIGGTTNNGTVFELKEDTAGNWNETILYSFGGVFANDLSGPNSVLTAVYDKEKIAALFGTCTSGGPNNQGGGVFELTPHPDGKWTETLIYNFQSISDGENPLGGVTFDKNGNLYGTTQVGGTNQGGTVYELVPSQTGWSKIILHNFNSPANPEGHLVFDRSGALYGTTPSDGPGFSGTIFQLVPPTSDGQDWTYNLLYTFTGTGGDGDGAYPRGGLIIVGKDTLYGTTEAGGNAGFGTVFQLLPPSGKRTTWKERQIYRFNGDASEPIAGLISTSGGVLYGTTSRGGPFYSGAVYELKPQRGKWIETTLWSFGGSGDGSNPEGALLFKKGALYGTTPMGGAFGQGAVYKIIP
jgi:uncharacterized repeat protein (TIGR03803 family)